MRSSIIAGLNAGACGITHWGWDLGGFSGDIPSAELYIRATQFAAFCPIFQYHSEFNHHRKPSRDRTPWNIAERTANPRALTLFHTYTQLRERLVPYLHAQSTAGIRRGEPLMRAAALFGDGNAQAWQTPDVYLLGDDLLVAPVAHPGATSRTAYLPEGQWIDVWNGQQVTGGKIIERETPVEEIPVWCRAQAWPDMKKIFAP
jgi:alpha-glucosidase (family GH31 glycosyl hydrolase)